MTQTTVQLFVNPRAGSQTRARTRALCDALEAGGARLLVTQSLSEQLVVDDRADHVCAVGGDGTLRHVVDAVRRAGRQISVSTYPSGTVNLLATECDYPRDPKAFAQRILGEGKRRQHYAARVGQVPLLVCASVGPDSHAVANLSPRLKAVIGRAAYVVAFARLLLSWPRANIMVTTGDRQIACEAVYIAKGRFFAGRYSFARAAGVGDPVLHVATLQRATRLRFLSFAWALLWGRPVERCVGVECFTCTELLLSSDGAQPLQVDGDIVANLPLSIALEPQAIHFA